MAAPFGELLGRFVPLSGHDVAEILEDQAVSHRRFGDIALRLGLCRPDHVWRAWGVQLSQQTQQVDLEVLGIDAQAVACLDGPTAREFQVIPIRALEDQVICATSERHLARVAEILPQRMARKAQFVLADERQVASAIERYYSAGA